MRAILRSSNNREPKLAPDATTIGQREMARIRASAGQPFPIKSILRRNSPSRSSCTSLQVPFSCSGLHRQ